MARENYESTSFEKINAITVKEFAAMLAALPEEVQNYTISCMGCYEFYLHKLPVEKAILMDEYEVLEV